MGTSIRGWVIPLLATLWAGTAGAQQASCDRACLTKLIDAYYAALIANNPAGLPQAAQARITENSHEKKLAEVFWPAADAVAYRFDVVNIRRGDTGTQSVVHNADGTRTMYLLRMKVKEGAITEIEILKANQGDADRLWGDDLKGVSHSMTMSIREQDRDSYYDLIGTAESYWRAFQSNGTPNYRRARLAPGSTRFENGLQTTGTMRNGVFNDTSKGFDEGAFLGRNLWDRRYAVVDEERGIVLCILRFGLKAGAKSQSVATSNDRLVGEFFAIQNGFIQEVHATLVNLPDSQPAGWPNTDYGPAKGSTDTF
ncbi:MAG: hypothetical protein WDO12_09710 [Pseudomonadota bacterium]